MTTQRLNLYHFLISILLSTSIVLCPVVMWANSSKPQLWPIIIKYYRLSNDRSLEPSIRQQIRWHQAHPDALSGMSDNARLYLGYVTQETIKQGLPSELALIPFIESNYNPFAQSAKGAAGLWQIMPDLASASKLVINQHLDERRDIKKSTQAALTHLKYLHGRLDRRWDYAIAAYSAGEGRVRQAIRQAKRANNKLTWVSFLPAETQKYLPKLYALKRIIQDPSKVGIQLPNLPAEAQLSITPINRSFAFDHLSEICHIGTDQLHKLNPSWKGHLIDHTFTSTIILPRNTAFSCQKKSRRSPLFNNRWAYHKVKRADTLKNIAKLYKTSPNAIMLYNGLTNHTIYPEQSLIIRIGKTNPPIISHDASLNTAILSAPTSGPTQLQHRVKPGDTIESIAQRYALKATHIAYWNQLKYPYALNPGKNLVLWRHETKPIRYIKYIVKSGDTVSLIAKKHKISQKQLLSANKIANINSLKVNQVLTIRQP